MSLDVYLYLNGEKQPDRSGIFIRRNGKTEEISRAEWDLLFPEKEPILIKVEGDENPPAYHDNITHNLGEMAASAGIYLCIWRPEELNISEAKDLIAPLHKGIR